MAGPQGESRGQRPSFGMPTTCPHTAGPDVSEWSLLWGTVPRLLLSPKCVVMAMVMKV